MLAVVITISMVAFVFALALCKAAGDADRWEEKWIEQRKHDTSINYKWCDDDCLRCLENDWCKFSEVKKESEVEEA